MIRPIKSNDFLVLNRLLPPRPIPWNSLDTTWVIIPHQQPVGYACFLPLPGLPEMVSLDGWVAPSWRKQGLGGELLEFVAAQAKNRSFSSLTCPFSTLQEPAAQFLLHRQFTIEHEEWRMVRSLQQLPKAAFPADFHLSTYSPTVAAHLFQKLYTSIFSAHAWYQPYSLEELLPERSSSRSGETYFLLHCQQPVGFVRVCPIRRFDTHQAVWQDVDEIEPLGILPSYQGQGLGRALLLHCLQLLANRGVQAVELGVWADNEPAWRLYEAVGFDRAGTTTYLTRSL